jgi:hypothetical protein
VLQSVNCRSNCPSEVAPEIAGSVSALRKDLQNGVHVVKLNTFAGGSMLSGTLAFDSGKRYRQRALWLNLGHQGGKKNAWSYIAND